MANIIQRIIQLVLDKESAKKTQKDIDSVADKADNKWKEVAGKIAGYLGAAFLAKKMLDFGKASVEEAAKSQAAWAALKGTIDNTGDSFDKLEIKLRATADAFQDATIHDDDAFAETLGRIITLTGDTQASLNNMGLVANVAAQFFKGELEPAANLVAKAMNGNVNMLKKLGIEADNAQQALEILAQRSMGAASREAQTYAGQVAQLNNAYDDMLKAFGEAIIGSDGSADAFKVLQAAVKTLTDWIEANKDAISRWVTEGVKFAIDAADVFIRAVDGMARVVGGGFTTAMGLGAQGVAKFIQSIVAFNEVQANMKEWTGQDVTEQRAEIGVMKAQAKAIDEWGESMARLGSSRVQKGIDILSTPLFSSDQFSNLPKTAAKTPGEDNKPTVGKNIHTEEGDAVKKAIKEFNESALSAKNMSRILGDSFDSTGAEVERLTKLINVLAANGTTPIAQGLGDLSTRFKDLVQNIVPTTTAARELSKSFIQDFATSSLTAAESTDLLASRVDWLKTQQGELMKAMQTLVAAGMDPSSAAVQQYASQYRALGEEIQKANLQQVFEDLAQTMSTDLMMATLDHSDQLEMLKSEHGALQKAIQALIAQGISKEDEAFKRLVARYGQVTEAIEDQTTAMQLQAAAADFLAEALGAALQGGLAEAAAQKAKQNAIEAAEMLVRAGVFALFGDFAHASASLVLAGQFAAVSAAWAALGAASRGGGGSSAPSISSANVGGTGSDLSSGRQSSSDAASKAVDPTAEVSIYLVGPGFHAMNPEVAKVVRGAAQTAKELYGNARVRVVSSEG